MSPNGRSAGWSGPEQLAVLRQRRGRQPGRDPLQRRRDVQRAPARRVGVPEGRVGADPDASDRRRRSCCQGTGRPRRHSAVGRATSLRLPRMSRWPLSPKRVPQDHPIPGCTSPDGYAISRRRPPQCEHASTSSANARCINAAQLQAREPLFAFVPSAPAASGDAKAVGSGATRPYATTRARQRARAARSPWQISRFGPAAASSPRDAPAAPAVRHQLARPVVPRLLQLQRDAAVAP